ncbi:MAG TPA: class I SAM-dependent methyltransferase [Marmoricola sp.]|nr:class I SAM-dependent methyltransferase [Marmoricola sp.]
MSFEGGAEAYDRFMGLWSRPLAAETVRLLEPEQGSHALDVGCGPGSLTGALVSRLGVGGVTAVDPTPPFVEAVRERFPGVEVRQASAESLPFDDGTFDLCVAQLVVHFMKDPVAGLREMARVTRPDGVVAASVWDHATGPGPLTAFWAGVRRLDPNAAGEADLAGTHDGELVELARRAGLAEPRQAVLTVHRRFESFEDWWEPFTLGMGPAGAHVARLDRDARERLREACREELPADGPFELPARAWCVVARP